MNSLDTGSFMSLISSVNGEIEFNEGMYVSDCYPDPEQPRYKDLTPDGVKDICATLQMKGGRIWQPILVHEEDDDGYRIIMGHRRWLASKVEDRETIPALIVKSGIDSKSFELIIQLVENVSRKDLDIREEGRSYKRLKEDFKLMGKEISESLKRPESFVSEAIMMFEMEDNPKLAFLNDLYEDSICRDTSTLVPLIRLARINHLACKRLVDWAIQNNCLNRKWAKSLKKEHLEGSFEEQIKALEERYPVNESKPSQKSPLPSVKGDHESTEDVLPSKDNEHTEINQEEQPVVNSEKEESSIENDETEENFSSNDESVSDNALFKTRPVSKAQINVTYKNTLACLLLERVDNKEGYAWIQLDGQDNPTRVLVEDLMIIHVG